MHPNHRHESNQKAMGVPDRAHSSENPNLNNRGQLIGSSLVCVHQTVQSMIHGAIRKGPLFMSQRTRKR
jgi:hypothetical protein